MLCAYNVSVTLYLAVPYVMLDLLHRPTVTLAAWGGCWNYSWPIHSMARTGLSLMLGKSLGTTTNTPYVFRNHTDIYVGHWLDSLCEPTVVITWGSSKLFSHEVETSCLLVSLNCPAASSCSNPFWPNRSGEQPPCTTNCSSISSPISATPSRMLENELERK